ncbi:MAG: hypothetical protein RTV41_07975 [Candidatus Thorarchaeota archaeon]
MAQKERRFIQDIPRYFIHGLLYAIIGTLATMVLALVTMISTIVVGAVAIAVGELVGYVMLAVFFLVLLLLVFFVAGLINAMLSRSFWKAIPSGGFKAYVGHGALLILVLTIFGIPNMAIDVFLPNLDFLIFVLLAIPRIIVYAIIDGYIGRWVAYGLSDFPVATKSMDTEDGVAGTCPQCGFNTIVKIREEFDNKLVTCQSCGTPFEIPKPEE